MKKIRFVFDGPPGPECGRFVEVENEKGESISIGEWVEEGKFWYLEFPDHRTANAELLEALEQMSSWFDVDGYANSVPPRVFVFKMREAIRKHKGK